MKPATCTLLAFLISAAAVPASGQILSGVLTDDNNNPYCETYTYGSRINPMAAISKILINAGINDRLLPMPDARFFEDATSPLVNACTSNAGGSLAQRWRREGYCDRDVFWFLAIEDVELADDPDANEQPLNRVIDARSRFQLDMFRRFSFSAAEDAKYSLVFVAEDGARIDVPDGLLMNPKRLSNAFAGISGERVIIECTPTPSSGEIAESGHGNRHEQILSARRRIKIRGKVDDLAVLHDGALPSSSKNKAFAKLDPGEIAFSNNAEAGERQFNTKFVAAIGTSKNLGRGFDLFAAYEFKDVRNENNEEKNSRVHHVTPGLLWFDLIQSDRDRRTRRNWALYAALSGRVSSTIDLAQNSEILQARLALTDVILENPILPIFDRCDRNLEIGPALRISCRYSLFSEAGHVFDAGISDDLAQIDDDQYVGLGGALSLDIFTEGEIGSLELDQFTWRTSYRRMEIISGNLDDPDRFETKILYQFPNTWASIELSYQEGQNFLTFQDEEVFKLSVGYKQ